jgi:hypothetical protein
MKFRTKVEIQKTISFVGIGFLHICALISLSSNLKYLSGPRDMFLYVDAKTLSYVELIVF